MKKTEYRSFQKHLPLFLQCRGKSKKPPAELSFLLDGYYEKDIFYSSSESCKQHIFCWVEVQHAKLFEVRGLHRFHGIGDMAECINADIAKRLGIRHSTDAEGIENIKKTLHIKCTKSSKQDIIVQAG